MDKLSDLSYNDLVNSVNKSLISLGEAPEIHPEAIEAVKDICNYAKERNLNPKDYINPKVVAEYLTYRNLEDPNILKKYKDFVKESIDEDLLEEVAEFKENGDPYRSPNLRYFFNPEEKSKSSNYWNLTKKVAKKIAPLAAAALVIGAPIAAAEANHQQNHIDFSDLPDSFSPTDLKMCLEEGKEYEVTIGSSVYIPHKRKCTVLQDLDPYALSIVMLDKHYRDKWEDMYYKGDKEGYGIQTFLDSIVSDFRKAGKAGLEGITPSLKGQIADILTKGVYGEISNINTLAKMTYYITNASETAGKMLEETRYGGFKEKRPKKIGSPIDKLVNFKIQKLIDDSYYYQKLMGGVEYSTVEGASKSLDKDLSAACSKFLETEHKLESDFEVEQIRKLGLEKYERIKPKYGHSFDVSICIDVPPEAVKAMGDKYYKSCEGLDFEIFCRQNYLGTRVYEDEKGKKELKDEVMLDYGLVLDTIHNGYLLYVDQEGYYTTSDAIPTKAIKGYIPQDAIPTKIPITPSEKEDLKEIKNLAEEFEKKYNAKYKGLKIMPKGEKYRKEYEKGAKWYQKFIVEDNEVITFPIMEDKIKVEPEEYKAYMESLEDKMEESNIAYHTAQDTVHKFLHRADELDKKINNSYGFFTKIFGFEDEYQKQKKEVEDLREDLKKTSIIPKEASKIQKESEETISYIQDYLNKTKEIPSYQPLHFLDNPFKFMDKLWYNFLDKLEKYKP